VITVGVPNGEEAWLAKAHVLLGTLEHDDEKYKAALGEFDAALRILKRFPLAQLRRAETLRADGRYVEAAAALDAYLAAGGADYSSVYKMRGLIHAARREFPQADGASTPAPRSPHPRTPETRCD